MAGIKEVDPLQPPPPIGENKELWEDWKIKFKRAVGNRQLMPNNTRVLLEHVEHLRVAYIKLKEILEASQADTQPIEYDELAYDEPADELANNRWDDDYDK